MSETQYADDELLPLSGIQHFHFCPRQWALIHVERQWADDRRTAEGLLIHERADDPFLTETRGQVIVTRAVPLISRSLGLRGTADVVEYTRSRGGIVLPGREGRWTVRPVEYKRGKPKPDERDEVQVCAQAICLEEQLGCRIESADLYYHEHRRRVAVALTDELRGTVAALSREMHALFRAGTTPPAIADSRRCTHCSLRDLCMPGLTRKRTPVRGYIRRHVQSTIEEAG
ncbi:MAG TPA: CRISPR-associated protein Cas4 [Methanoregulaceae archaeon]|nr:CRISPR-associated protein Cas4 [Methanoregulaceae archaeon]